MKKCVFCEKIKNEDLPTDGACVWFEPLNPVVKGHLLVVPIRHVSDFTKSWKVSSAVMMTASVLAREMGNVNLITSKGKNATQSIKHLHIHLIPRRKGDKLLLPWSNQKKGGNSSQD